MSPDYRPAESDVMVYEKRDFEEVRLAAVDAMAPIDILASYIMSSDLVRPYLKQQILSDPRTEGRFKKRLSERAPH